MQASYFIVNYLNNWALLFEYNQKNCGIANNYTNFNAFNYLNVVYSILTSK